MRLIQIAASAAALLFTGANADIPQLPVPQSCSGVTNSRFQYTTASGWSAFKIAGGLKQVRTIVWDTEGNMLVAESGRGISVHSFGEDGCINSTSMLIQANQLNHGLALSPDGKTMYASGETGVYSWSYDPVTRSISNQKTLITGISTGIHFTRTIAAVPDSDLILVQVGSNSNLDMATQDPSAGRAIIKVFDAAAAPANGYNYNTDGEVFAYGLRNTIGFVPDPSGVYWGVENSGDDFARTENGQRIDIHQDNPAEELNNLGNPLDPERRNVWYGYPTCFTVWDPSPFSGLKTGDQFVLSPSATFNDASCVENGSVPPRLSFQAHSAPIWNTFNADGTKMYVSFHGSWDRQPPTGFKVVEIPFQKLDDGSYEPVAAADSQDGYTEIFGAPNPESCTANGLTMSNCLRLTAAAWDPSGRGLFVGSDNSAEGEIFILTPSA
ncbi:hypothetical protein VTH82DRAFT_2364 [Thermothelomyces myriococcoides]